jgi:hypothetical protein
MSSRLLPILRHAWREERTVLWALLFALLLAALIFRLTGIEWWEWGEAIITLATLGVGIIIWFGEAAEDWEESLPKRLTVEFLFAPPGQPPRLVMACRLAPLADVGDIRPWAIALGAQMDGGKRQLKYRADFTLLPPEVIPGPDGAPCRHYLIRFALDELPERVAKLEAEQPRPVCIEWTLADGHRQETLGRAPLR